MIFILGIERSATTWISNLIESHPDTSVYVEPLSELTARFKKWPERFELIKDIEKKAEYFHAEFEIIKKHRTWFFTKVSKNRFAWQFDLWLSNYLVRKQLATEAARDFSEINFHRKAQLVVTKSDKKQVEVIKELRLNFNAQIIPFIDPDARIIVVIRNLFATIQSIQKHLEQGNLAELNKLLIKHYGEINEITIFKYWHDSYNSLFENLDQSNTNYLTLYHTNFMLNPEEEIRRMCNFLDLSDTAPVLCYLDKSNQKGVGIHNTNREHDLLLKQNEEARDAVSYIIREELEKSKFHSKVRKAVEYKC